MKFDKVKPQFLFGGILLAGTALQAEEPKPNIIVILSDDLGYSDMGCYGGEINTPNLDRLAGNGLRFTRFYNASRSCPTRASLLSGLYQHQAGVGRMTGNMDLPGYQGELTPHAVTIAEVLKTAGYQTGMVGKWHVSETNGKSDQAKWLAHQVYYPDFARRSSYPTHRGFDHFYGVIWGVVNHFDPFSLVNGEEPVREVPDDYYVTQAFSDSAVAYVNRYALGDEPFFLYLAYTAPHWPLHALPEDIAKYEEVYKCGWDQIRDARYQRMLDKKIFGEHADFLSKRNPSNSWAENGSKDWDARAMAVHAAMVDRMDQGIGQLIEALEKNGQLDNTLILFMSDNGCSSEDCQNMSGGAGDRPNMTRGGEKIIYPKNKDIDPGAETTFASIGKVWANVANTPFRMWKAKSYEGGICTPLIAHWPKGIKKNTGGFTHEAGHVMDIMATCIDLAGATYPENYNGNVIIPLEGMSLVPVLETGKRERHKEICFEHFGEKALISEDNWKIVKVSGERASWELYDLNTDRTEKNNLASQYPQKTAELAQRYETWAKRCLVKPGPDDPVDVGPIAISSAIELDYMRAHLKGSFYLTSDIVLSPGVEWVPIGSKNAMDNDPAPFEGIFDGRGYSISHLTIQTQGDFKGLFGRLKHATVKDLALHVNIKGNNVVGGLSGAAFAETNIERVSVSGYVEGNEQVGGIIGRTATDPTYPEYNLITDCYVDAHVKAKINSAGGLLGIARWKVKIKNAYVAGKVEAHTGIKEGNAAGILSANEDPHVQAEAVAVVADEITGGTPGYFFSRKNNFQSSGKLFARYDIPEFVFNNNNDKGSGHQMITGDMLLRPEVFASRSFYENTLGWDFTETWKMIPDKKYPVLRGNTSATLSPIQKPLNYQVSVVTGGILLTTEERPFSLSIYNPHGQKVYAASIVGSPMYIPLQQGLYIIKAKSDLKESNQKMLVK